MAKINNKNNKKRCEKYKLLGRREENKAKKQMRHLKRLEHFAKRKEEGKTYSYKANSFKRGTDEYREEAWERFEKSHPIKYKHKTDYQKWKSIFAKLDREIELEKQAAKDKTKKAA